MKNDENFRLHLADCLKKNGPWGLSRPRKILSCWLVLDDPVQISILPALHCHEMRNGESYCWYSKHSSRKRGAGKSLLARMKLSWLDLDDLVPISTLRASSCRETTSDESGCLNPRHCSEKDGVWMAFLLRSQKIPPAWLLPVLDVLVQKWTLLASSCRERNRPSGSW